MTSELELVVTLSDVPTKDTYVCGGLTAAQVGQLGRQVRVRDMNRDEPLHHQLDIGRDGDGELVLRVPPRGDSLHLRVEATAEIDETPGLIAVETLADYEGQETYRIKTPSCELYYHKEGAGFASLIDPDGADWLSFKPWGGSDGIYRGIPNLAHPENIFHPGARTCVTATARLGPLRATLESRSHDGEWSCRWQIYPDRAELTVLGAGHPYWVLYEGTPGGVLNEAEDYCVRADGLKRSLVERWDEVLPGPKWICFGKNGLERVLYLASHHPAHDEVIDSFWPMEGNMTVFGFGRTGLDKFLQATPATFSFGLCETAQFDEIAREIKLSDRTRLLVESNEKI